MFYLNPHRKSVSALVAAGLGLAAIGATQAAIVVTNNSSASAFAVSNNDLLEGLTGVVTGTALAGQEGTSSDPTILTNGTFGLGGNPLDVAETVSVGNNTTITWQLDTGASPAGYDISGINIYSGWRDAGRDNMDFTVRFATVAAPGVFNDITTVSFAPAPANSGESLISDDAGLIATGVGEIQVFFGNQENGYVGYREVDVIGSPVPEPSTFALLALAGLGVFARRRR